MKGWKVDEVTDMNKFKQALLAHVERGTFKSRYDCVLFAAGYFNVGGSIPVAAIDYIDTLFHEDRIQE